MHFFRLLISLLFLLLVNTACSSIVADSTDIKAETNQEEALNYSGWAALTRQTIDPTAEEDDWIFMQDIKIKDNGQIIKIQDEGKETGYSVQLIVITYENTNTTVLKLGVIEDATDYTKAYAWAEPGAERVGINVRWVQSGFTLDKPE